MKTKICSKCKVKKSFDEFSNRTSSKDGKRSQCKICEKQYCQDNKESIDKRQKIYRDAHKEESQQWRSEHKEYREEYDKQYYINNIEKCTEYNKRYREENVDKLCIMKHKYYLKNKETLKSKREIYRKNNVKKIRETCRRYYKSNPKRMFKLNKQWRLNNPERVRQHRRNAKAKRRGFGKPLAINKKFEGSEEHHLHINGNTQITIFIPKELHRSVWHSHHRKDTMDEINELAMEWYFHAE